MNKKAAIEFSANVLVVIIISSVILGLGLMLFFNLRSSATKYTESIEQQTAEQLKALMLNDNSRLALYPNDLDIPAGKSMMTTIALLNNYDSARSFQSFNVEHWEVFYFATPQTPGISLTSTPPPHPWFDSKKVFIVSSGNANGIGFGNVNPGEQSFKNILVKMPKEAKKGQYVVTIPVYNGTCTHCMIYARAKLYISVP